jgi:hypothetical protein
MRSRVLLLIAVVSCWASVLAAAAYGAKPPVLGDPAEEAAALRKEFDALRGKIAQAVDDAEKAGKLDPATLTYFRETIAQFEKADPFQLDVEKLHFPAKSEGDPALGRIQLACVKLKAQIERAQERVAHFHMRYRDRAATLLREAARRAKSPEELKPVEDLVATWQSVPNLRPSNSALWQARGATERALVSVRSLLEAMKQEDASLLEDALRKVQSDGVAAIEESRLGDVSFWDEPLVKVFAPRILDPRKQKVGRMQAELERKIVQGGPVGELEAAIVEFEKEANAVASLRQAAEPPAGFAGDSSELTDGYRAMLRITEALRGEPLPQHAAWRIPEFRGSRDGALTPSAALRTRLAELQIQWSVHLQKVQARKKADDQAQATAAQAIYEKEQRAAFEEVAKTVRTKMQAIKTPADALALAEQLPERWPVDKTMTWELVRRELRGTARWWADGVVPDLLYRASREPAYESNHPFVGELRMVRQRALRKVLEKELEITELAEARFAEMDPVDALLKLANEGSKKSEWKRVHVFLQALEPLDPTGRFHGIRMRRETVQTFLAAENLEKAEQYAGAARGYLTVIGTVGEGLPTQEAINRLKALRKERPEAAKVEAYPATGTLLRIDGQPQSPVHFEESSPVEKPAK